MKNTLRSLQFILLLSVLPLLLVGCDSRENQQAFLWGETQSYDNFLWKKYIPDTLTQTVCFDFNTDARQYMVQPLQLALFERGAEGGIGQKVQPSDAQLFVNSRAAEDNVISVSSDMAEISVGVVFSDPASDGVHYWYLRPVNDGGLDRINDHECAYYDNEVITEVRVKVSHVMNPLAKGLMIAGIVLLALLILWLLVLKPMLFPTFRVSRIALTGPQPYFSVNQVKRCRLFVLTSQPRKQGWVSKFLTGEVKYGVNPMWTADIVFEPKDKRSIRIRPDKNEYMVDARLLKLHEEHTIENLNTKTKTIVTVS